MLSKLLKHEFRATARIMGPLFLIVMALAVAANLSIRFLIDSDAFVPNLLGGLMLFAFVIGLMALVIMSIVLMVNRFRTNLMGDEGYVMFTLPTSAHQLVWSKIIVSTAWFVVTGVVEVLAMLVCVFDLKAVQDIFSSDFFNRFAMGFKILVEEYGFNLPVMAIEIIVLGLLGCAVLCLEFYAAMAVGHSFANHKMALSVLFFFVFQFAVQFIGGLFINIDGLWDSLTYNWDGMAAFHRVMGIMIASSLIVGAIYYVVTTMMLKKRINLQ